MAQRAGGRELGTEAAVPASGPGSRPQPGRPCPLPCTLRAAASATTRPRELEGRQGLSPPLWWWLTWPCPEQDVPGVL